MAVSNLSPYQQAIQNAVGKGKGATADAATLGRIADQVFGPAPVPPGSQIIYQDAQRVEWLDPQGYRHSASRSLDGRDPSAGQWRDNTDRPAVLPNKQQEGVTQALGQAAQQAFASPLAFAQIDPDTMARLKAISDAEQAANAQALEDQRGQLVAQLYGNRVNQSSIANDAAARFAQYYGLVNQRQQSDAANREFAARQYLTGLGSERNSQLANLYANLSGQGTQRDIAGAGIDLDKLKLAESGRQYNLGYGLDQQKADMALAEQNSPFNKFLKALNASASLASGVGTVYGAYKVGRGK